MTPMLEPFARILGAAGGRIDLGLLLIRIMLAGSQFLNHGLEKLLNFSTLIHSFGDPIGVGGPFSFLVAFTSDAVCTGLIAFGLFTRVSALVIFINTSVAFVVIHHARLHGSGEVPWTYMGLAALLFFGGAGRYSLDHRLFGQPSRAEQL